MKNIGLGLQWMLFMVAASIVVPISIADLFSLSPAETAILMQNTIFMVGIGSLLDGLIGHKMPIAESPAGIWWSVLVIYCTYTGVYYTTKVDVVRVFYSGMMFSGLLFILLSVTGLMKKVSKVFTPTATFIYLTLLSLQLSGTFLNGIVGINSKNMKIDPIISILSIVVIFITFYLGSSKILLVKQFSVVISIVIGWILFIIFGKASPVLYSEKLVQLPKLFAFGTPKFDVSMLTTSFFITFILIMNMFASMNIMSSMVNPNKALESSRYSMSGLISGINQILGGIFNTVGTVPVSSSAGFVSQIGEKSIKPFILGSIFISVLALIPNFMNLMAALPTSIGYSVTFVIFSKMISMALFELKKVISNVEFSYLIIGICLLAGVGVLFLPVDATKDLPKLVSSFLGNGLIVGTVLGIILEQAYLFKTRKN